MRDEDKELTYGETIKQPFPERDKIDWVKVEAPEWLRSTWLDESMINVYLGKQLNPSTIYAEAKNAYENSQDFKVTWQLKQTDSHADIKAEYEKAITEGKIVKVFYIGELNAWISTPKPNWIEGYTYKLRYYEIDWNKLLSWSYANGEFVECELDDNSDFRLDYKSELRGIEDEGAFLNEFGDSYKYCRLAKGVEIKDEWLKETK